MSDLLLRALFLCAVLTPATATAGYSPCPSTDWGVSTLALEVEQAYIARSERDLREALDEVSDAVRCLEESISPESAAAVHRAFALAAFWDLDEAAAASALQAALMAEPSWEPPVELAPPGRDLAMAIERARAERPPSRTNLTAPVGLALRLDGAPSWRRWSGLPVLVQIIDAEGHPIQSEYLGPDAPLPVGLDPAPGRDGSRAPTMRVSAPSRGARVLLVSGAGVLGAGAVGLGLSSASIRSDWAASVEQCDARIEGCSPATDRLNARDHRLATRLGIGAGVAAAGAAALGIGVVLRW